jgi:hypothetical protein
MNSGISLEIRLGYSDIFNDEPTLEGSVASKLLKN